MIMLKSNLLLKKMIMVTGIPHFTRRWIPATDRLTTTPRQTKMKMNKQLMGCVTAIKFISFVVHLFLIIKRLLKFRFQTGLELQFNNNSFPTQTQTLLFVFSSDASVGLLNQLRNT